MAEVLLVLSAGVTCLGTWALIVSGRETIVRDLKRGDALDRVIIAGVILIGVLALAALVAWTVVSK